MGWALLTYLRINRIETHLAARRYSLVRRGISFCGVYKHVRLIMHEYGMHICRCVCVCVCVWEYSVLVYVCVFVCVLYWWWSCDVSFVCVKYLQVRPPACPPQQQATPRTVSSCMASVTLLGKKAFCRIFLLLYTFGIKRAFCRIFSCFTLLEWNVPFTEFFFLILHSGDTTRLWGNFVAEFTLSE